MGNSRGYSSNCTKSTGRWLRKKFCHKTKKNSNLKGHSPPWVKDAICVTQPGQHYFVGCLWAGCQFSILGVNPQFWVSILNSPSECLLFHSQLAGNRGWNWNSSSARNLSYFAREIENISIENFDFCLVHKVHPQPKRGERGAVWQNISFCYTYSDKCMKMPGRITWFNDLKTYDNKV